MIMPVDIPLWMVAVSVAFAVLIAKEAFGGTGMNILNPALTARAFAFLHTHLHVWKQSLGLGSIKFRRYFR